jgi:hypothetical protein
MFLHTYAPRENVIAGGGAALGPNGTEYSTREGVRNNAKSIYNIQMLAAGFRGRAK